MFQVRLQERTHQVDPTCAWISLDEFRQSFVRHPLRDDLQRVFRDTDERDNVRVSKHFPDGDLFGE